MEAKALRGGGDRAALFLISFSLIAFELAIMRVFSAGSWSNFGSMVISIALLGYGVAGVGLTFIQERVRRNPRAWLAGSAIILPAMMAFCYSLAQRIPFNPIFLINQPKQAFFIACFYVLYSLPFLVGAVFTAAAFMMPGERMQNLYFWNMAGSGLGGLALILATYALKTEYLVYPVTALASVAAFIAALRGGRETGGGLTSASGGRLFKLRWPAAATASVIASFLALALAGKMNVSPYKASEQAKLMFPDLKTVHEEHGPLGEYEIYQSDRFHFAPGLSDNAVFYIDEMPKNAFWGMYIDNDGPIGIMRRLEPSEETYIDFLPMSAAYALLSKPDVLLVKLGGGFSAYTALHHQASSVTILEPNPVIARISRDVPAVREFNGDLLRDPRVRVVEEEPRAFCSRGASGKYDLVEISLIDSIGLSQSTGYSITENYLYTVEAMESYLKRLGDDGILSVTVWNTLSPPRNVPKLISTVAEALRRSGYADPGKHFYGFDLIYSTATILVKKSPFSAEDIKKLNAFCAKMSFKPFYAPDQADPGKDFEAILAAYKDKFRTKKAEPGAEPEDPSAGSIRLDVDDLFAYASRWALSGRADELYAKYLFDIRPTTDDRPYYSVYMKPSTAPLFLDKLTYVSEDWSYFLSWATLFQAVGFGVLIALMPLLKRKASLKGIGSRRTVGVMVYYACLGAGYMLVEIFLMQKLVFFLAEPVFSTSIVITSMLIISGLGSLLSERISPSPAKRVQIAAIAICATLGVYALGLSPFLELLLGLPLWAKIPIAVMAIAPAAFFMGMPFPTGLSRLTAGTPALLPWAYGVNGALSVTGSLLAQIVSMHSGFVWVLGLAFALYALSGVLFKVNERPVAMAAKGT